MMLCSRTAARSDKPRPSHQRKRFSVASSWVRTTATRGTCHTDDNTCHGSSLGGPRQRPAPCNTTARKPRRARKRVRPFPKQPHPTEGVRRIPPHHSELKDTAVPKKRDSSLAPQNYCIVTRYTHHAPAACSAGRRLQKRKSGLSRTYLLLVVERFPMRRYLPLEEHGRELPGLLVLGRPHLLQERRDAGRVLRVGLQGGLRLLDLVGQ